MATNLLSKFQRRFQSANTVSNRRSNTHPAATRRRRLQSELLERRNLLTVLVPGYSESTYADNLNAPSEFAVDIDTGTMVYATDQVAGPFYRLDSPTSNVPLSSLPGSFAYAANDIEWNEGLIYTTLGFNQLIELDPQTGASTTLATLTDSFLGVGVAVRDNVIYATGGGSSLPQSSTDPMNGALWSYDLDTQQLTQITNSMPSGPRGLEYVALTDQFFTSTKHAIYEVELDGTTNLVATFPTAARTAGNMAVDADGQFAYVTTIQGFINQVDLSTGAITPFIQYGGEFFFNDHNDDLNFAPASSGTGTSLFVTNRQNNKIVEISGAFPELDLNKTPEFAGLAVTHSIDEGQVATLSGTIVDQNDGDTFTLSLDWGDGNTNNLVLGLTALSAVDDDGDLVTWDPVTRDFSVDHAWIDDGISPGNGTSSDDYVITGSVTDSGGKSADLLIVDHANAIVNGNFETGDFTGWEVLTIENPFGQVINDHVISDGTYDPPGGVFNNAPLEGSYDAVSINTVQGQNQIKQSFVVPENITDADIRWKDQIFNPGFQFIDPDQEFQVNLLDSNGSLIQELYSTSPGDELFQSGGRQRYVEATTLLQGYEGQTLTLQFDQTTTLSTFNVYVDDVQVNFTTASPVITSVDNVAPTFDAGNDEFIGPLVDGTFTRTGVIVTDPGTQDELTVELDFDGDSIVDQTITLPADGSSTRSFDLTYTYTAEGTFPVSVTVTDDDGGTSTSSFDITVDLNFAPDAVDDVAGEASVNESEAGPVDLTAVMGANDTDPDNDPLTVISIDDSSITAGSLTLVGGVVSFDPQGEFESLAAGETAIQTFTYTVEDLYGLTDTATVDIVITGENDGPSITSLAGSNTTLLSKGTIADPITVTGELFDIDITDTHTVTIDWGDGTVETFAVDSNEPSDVGTFAEDHVYAEGGFFDITVTVDDGNGGTDTQTTSAVIAGVGVANGTLYVIGTDGRDKVSVKFKSWHNGNADQVRVKTKFAGQGVSIQYFAAADIDKIEIHLCDGNDAARISGRDIGAGPWYESSRIDGGDGNDWILGGVGDDIIVGGDGNDFIRGGAGDDVISGGEGNDYLFGRSGDDILIGGNGSDLLFGNAGDDLLIAGTTDNDSDFDSLDLAIEAWTTGDLANTLAELGDLHADCDWDLLIGGAGSDAVFGDHWDAAW